MIGFHLQVNCLVLPLWWDAFGSVFPVNDGVIPWEQCWIAVPERPGTQTFTKSDPIRLGLCEKVLSGFLWPYESLFSASAWTRCNPIHMVKDESLTLSRWHLKTVHSRWWSQGILKCGLWCNVIGVLKGNPAATHTWRVQTETTGHQEESATYKLRRTGVNSWPQDFVRITIPQKPCSVLG